MSNISALAAANCSALRSFDVHGCHFATSVSLTIQIWVILVSTVVLLGYFCPRQSQRRWWCFPFSPNLSDTVSDSWISRSYTSLHLLYIDIQRCHNCHLKARFLTEDSCGHWRTQGHINVLLSLDSIHLHLFDLPWNICWTFIKTRIERGFHKLQVLSLRCYFLKGLILFYSGVDLVNDYTA